MDFDKQIHGFTIKNLNRLKWSEFSVESIYLLVLDFLLGNKFQQSNKSSGLLSLEWISFEIHASLVLSSEYIYVEWHYTLNQMLQ